MRSDHGLNVTDQAQLRSHLLECKVCAAYANQLSEAEKSLRNVMKQKWNAHPLPHNKDIILSKVNSNKWYPSAFLSTRRALIGTTIVLFGLVLWQFGLTHGNQNSGVDLRSAVIPTPATALIESTANSLNECATTSYVVEKNDDLESIANKFSVSKETIININNLKSKTPLPHSQLQIPDCTFTPTGTVFAPTITITPVLQNTANTPG